MTAIREKHWETVYETKNPDQVSWTQEIPHTSLQSIDSLTKDKASSIIDIGGGDSRLVDFLLDEGFENITVLDISAKALENAQLRLGQKASKVKWITTDITEFVPQDSYDIWHDRATFHFLTEETERKKYLEIASKAVKGNLIIGTFSKEGPKKCSGLDIVQYDEELLSSQFEIYFEKLQCHVEDHVTPFNTIQNFLFCTFKKK